MIVGQIGEDITDEIKKERFCGAFLYRNGQNYRDGHNAVALCALNVFRCIHFTSVVIQVVFVG